MFLALHAPVRGVQKELSHEVNLFSVPKKLPGVKLFFSIYLPFFVLEKAAMYPVSPALVVFALGLPPSALVADYSPCFQETMTQIVPFAIRLELQSRPRQSQVTS